MIIKVNMKCLGFNNSAYIANHQIDNDTDTYLVDGDIFNNRILWRSNTYQTIDFT